MASAEMLILSESNTGRPIQIVQVTTGAAQLLHSTSGIGTANVDLVHLSAVNTDNSTAYVLHVEGGDAGSSPQFEMSVTLQPHLPVDLPTLALSGTGNEVEAYATHTDGTTVSSTLKINVWGYINRVTN